jgi:hypothetical protein
MSAPIETRFTRFWRELNERRDRDGLPPATIGTARYLFTRRAVGAMQAAAAQREAVQSDGSTP